MTEAEKQAFGRARRRMIRMHLIERDIHDERVLKVMGRLPREEFVPDNLRNSAYDDTPLPIGEGQTISQPYIVALMTQLLQLQGSEKILEIGTGSGYQTAILAELSKEVYSIERSAFLSHRAQEVLTRCGYTNVILCVGDGTLGWPDQSPYDRIIVTAGAPAVPKTLTQQLVQGGILVIPVGERYQQDLQIMQRIPEGFKVTSGGGCVFVPLVGQEGWPDSVA